MREADKSHTVIKDPGKPVQCQLAAFRVDMPFANFHAARSQPPPGTAVCLMVLIGDNHGVTRRQRIGKGLRQDIGVLACRGTEAQLVPLDIHQRRKPFPRLVHLGTAGGARRIAAIGLDLALGIKAMKPVDHLTAGVGAAGIFKEGPALKRRLGKGRKLRTDKIDIKACGHRTSCRAG